MARVLRVTILVEIYLRPILFFFGSIMLSFFLPVVGLHVLEVGSNVYYIKCGTWKLESLWR